MKILPFLQNFSGGSACARGRCEQQWYGGVTERLSRLDPTRSVLKPIYTVGGPYP
jgi:hypothetical protein